MERGKEKEQKIQGDEKKIQHCNGEVQRRRVAQENNSKFDQASDEVSKLSLAAMAKKTWLRILFLYNLEIYRAQYQTEWGGGQSLASAVDEHGMQRWNIFTSHLVIEELFLESFISFMLILKCEACFVMS